MWLFTNFGFFSIVRKPEDVKGRTLTIHARAKEDLVALRDGYLPDLGPIQEHTGSDYRYRARVAQAEFAIALLKIGLNIDYSDFKDSVAAQQGQYRAEVYHQAWNVVSNLQSAMPAPPPQPVVPARRKTSGLAGGYVTYGGVLFDEEGRVLLRKPAGEFDDYVWTFPTGRAELGKSAEETALRAVLEETGYRARIVGKLPGRFQGGKGTTEYFIMHSVGKPGPFDPRETQAVEWVTYHDAAVYILQTRNPDGMERDLKVLQTAVAEYKKLKGVS